jgi:hypothetical protein
MGVRGMGLLLFGSVFIIFWKIFSILESWEVIISILFLIPSIFSIDRRIQSKVKFIHIIVPAIFLTILYSLFFLFLLFQSFITKC